MLPIRVALPAWRGNTDSRTTTKVRRATDISEGRYDFQVVAVDTEAVDWNMAEALRALPRSEAVLDLLTFVPGSLAGLVAAEALLPLDEYLSWDALRSDVRTFQPDSYWPGFYASGQVRGIQYALPLYAGVYVTLVNQEVAERAGVELPAPDRLAFDRDSFLDLAQALHTPPPEAGQDGTPGLLMGVDPEVDPLEGSPVWPSSEFFLYSALGRLPGPEGLFEHLRSEAAVTAVETLRALVQEPGIGLRFSRVSWNLTSGNYGMMIWGMSGQALPSTGSPRVYPFPDFGSGRNPASVGFSIGIAAGSEDPALAYDALRWLEETLVGTQVLPSYLPARRAPAHDIRQVRPQLTEEEAALVVDLLEHPALMRLTSAERAILTRLVDAGAILGDVPADEALNQAADELEALRAEASSS